MVQSGRVPIIECCWVMWPSSMRWHTLKYASARWSAGRALKRGLRRFCRANRLRVDVSGSGQISLFEDLDRHGLAKKIALHFIAVQQSELAQLFLGLNAFRHYLELQRMRQVDDDRDQRHATRPGNHVDHERAVDLERVDG